MHGYQCYFCRSSPTILSYEVNVIPRFNFPAILLERIIRSDLPVNLRALACRAEENSEGDQKVGNTKDSKSMVLSNTINGVVCEKDELLQENYSRGGNSNSNGPLPPLSNELNSNWGVFGKVCRLDKRCMVDEVHLRRFDGLLVRESTLACLTYRNNF